MTTEMVNNKGVNLRVAHQGAGQPVVFAHALGTDLSIWDDVVAALPAGLHLIRYDLRGHGRSDVPPGPYSMGQMISDAEAICDHLAVRDAVIVGLSVGGMIAQGLAVKRLDLVRGLVLSHTAAKIGVPKLWDDRIAAIRAQGLAPFADTILDHWFGRDFRAQGDLTRWRKMLMACDPEGYAGVCAAISGTDFYTPTSGLRLPTLGLAGTEDRATPPDLVRETVALIPGADFHLLRRRGHLSCVEAPDIYAEYLTEFLTRIGHLPQQSG